MAGTETAWSVPTAVDAGVGLDGGGAGSAAPREAQPNRRREVRAKERTRPRIRDPVALQELARFLRLPVLEVPSWHGLGLVSPRVCTPLGERKGAVVVCALSKEEFPMKLAPIAGSVIATMLAIAGCSSTSKYAAVRSAEEREEEAREEAREARLEADRDRHEAAEAQADAQRAAQAQRDAEQRAQVAAQRAAQAEVQEGREANRYGVSRAGVTERQPDGSILFDPDRADLSEDADARLDEAIRVIRARGPGHTIVVQGYTDASGPEDGNVALSQRRASAVADYLARKGISRDRIVLRGLGSRNPVSRDDSDRGRALNRRVEIFIQP
jgi:outer membrane protein OmpA-like peptidoglycan-associated protein